MADKYDVVIIGSGPGGYVAAIRSAQLGLKTACVEKRSTLGGTCLNVGCIPSKTLLHATEVLALLKQHGAEQGIQSQGLNIDWKTLQERKNKVVKGLVDGVAGLFQKNHVEWISGTARFSSPQVLEVENSDKNIQQIEASSYILATGSEPISLPFLPFDEKQVLSSTGALSLKSIPKRLLVVGGGIIGVELASVYNRLGVQVTVVEMLDSICAGMDVSIQRGLLQTLKKQGIEFFLSTQVTTAVVQPDEVILTVNQQDQKLHNLSGEAVLVAIGRRPYTQGLGLDKAGVETTKRGFIEVDESFRTQQPHIYAIGDLLEGAMLAHRASAEGVAVAEILAGQAPYIDYMAIPNVIYTYPEAASVGLTEKEAQESSFSLQVGTAYFRGNARARCIDETEGFVKVIGDEATGRLLGMHILGPHASELIAEGMLAMQKKATLANIADAPQAHPTLSEAIKEAALGALGRPIHI